MRSRPATRTALFVDVRLALSPRNAARHPWKPRLRNAGFPARSSSHRSADLSPHPLDSQQLLKLTAQSFPCGGLFEEAATPRYPRRAMTHLEKTLRRFTLENRRKRQLYSN